MGISNSSTTSRSTTKTSSSPYRSDTQLRNTSTSTSNYEPTNERRVTHTSDSESEGSGRSLDLASSHSSDEEGSSGGALTQLGLLSPNINPTEPPQLNINSQLFQPIYAPRWPTSNQDNDVHIPHRWTASTISDNELVGIYRGPPEIKLSNIYSDQEDKASLGDKYLFPYTAEEDHSLCIRPQVGGPTSPSPLHHHHEFVCHDISENEKPSSETPV